MNNKKPCMKIALTDTKPSIFESKIGGTGYIPHDKDFPTDSYGNQLRLLAQIECDKIQLDGFPEKGLLQFWIATDEDLGCSWNNQTNQDGFRVIYYPEIDSTVTKEEIESKFVWNDYDYDHVFYAFYECGVSFEKSTDGNMKHDKITNRKNWEKSSWHKIGGYPYFIQFDPRTDMENGEYYDFPLFQIDMTWICGKNMPIFGDTGVGNFFINSEKLKSCDFSDVLYHWDSC